MSTVPVILTGYSTSSVLALQKKPQPWQTERHSLSLSSHLQRSYSPCRPTITQWHSATSHKKWSIKYTAAKSYTHTQAFFRTYTTRIYRFTLRVPCAMRFCDLLWCYSTCNGYLCEQSMQAALRAMIPYLRTGSISDSMLLHYSCLTVLSLSRPCPLNSTDLTSCFSNHEIPLSTIKCFAILFCCQAVTDKCW
jgi:hypothetical protein